MREELCGLNLINLLRLGPKRNDHLLSTHGRLYTLPQLNITAALHYSPAPASSSSHDFNLLPETIPLETFPIAKESQYESRYHVL